MSDKSRIAKLSDKQFAKELEVHGFKVRGDKIGVPVFPIAEAYEAYQKQFKVEDSEETNTAFIKTLQDRELTVVNRMTIRLNQLFKSINDRTSSCLMEFPCIVGISSPEQEYTCLSPFLETDR